MSRADGGLERHRADRGRCHHGAVRSDAGSRARRPGTVAGRRLRHPPKTSAGSWCRASRAALARGGRSRTVNPARFRYAKATCATAIEGIELKCPVVVESRELRCSDLLRGRQVPWRARDRHAGVQPGRGQVEFRNAAARQVSALGALERHPGEPGGYLMRLPGERDFEMMAQPHSRSDPRRGHRPHRGAAAADARERDPFLVREDVMEGLVSASAARKLYGVVLRGNLSLDERSRRDARPAKIGRKADARTNKLKKKTTRKAKRRRRDEALPIEPDMSTHTEAFRMTTGNVAIRVKDVSHQFGEAGDAAIRARAAATPRSTSRAASCCA